MADHGNGESRTTVWRVIVGITMPALGLISAFLGGKVWENSQAVGRMDERVTAVQIQAATNARLAEEVVAVRTRLEYISEQISDLKEVLDRKQDRARVPP